MRQLGLALLFGTLASAPVLDWWILAACALTGLALVLLAPARKSREE